MTNVSLAKTAAPLMEAIANPEHDAQEAVRRAEQEAQAQSDAAKAKDAAAQYRRDFYAALDSTASATFAAGNSIAALAGVIPHYVPTLSGEQYETEKKNWRMIFITRRMTDLLQREETAKAAAENRPAGIVSFTYEQAQAFFGKDAPAAKNWPAAVKSADDNARSILSQAFKLAGWKMKEGRPLTAEEIAERDAPKPGRGATRTEGEQAALDAVLASVTPDDLAKALIKAGLEKFGLIVSTAAKAIYDKAGQDSGEAHGLSGETRACLEVIEHEAISIQSEAAAKREAKAAEAAKAQEKAAA